METTDCHNCGDEVVVAGTNFREKQNYVRATAMTSEEEQIDYYPTTRTYCCTGCAIEALEEGSHV